MMTRKINLTLVLVLALCVLWAGAVFAAGEAQPIVPELEPGIGIEGISADISGERPVIIDPETGEELSATPRVVDIEPISDEIEPISAELEDEEDTDNTWLFVGAGIGILVLVGIVVFIMKKS